MRCRWRVVTTAAAALTVDAASKLAAVRYLAHNDVELMGSLVALRLGHNSGIAFGVGASFLPSS